MLVHVNKWEPHLFVGLEREKETVCIPIPAARTLDLPRSSTSSDLLTFWQRWEWCGPVFRSRKNTELRNKCGIAHNTTVLWDSWTIREHRSPLEPYLHEPIPGSPLRTKSGVSLWGKWWNMVLLAKLLGSPELLHRAHTVSSTYGWGERKRQKGKWRKKEVKETPIPSFKDPMSYSFCLPFHFNFLTGHFVLFQTSKVYVVTNNMKEEKVIYGSHRQGHITIWSFFQDDLVYLLSVSVQSARDSGSGWGSRHDPCFPSSSYCPTARQWAEWKEEGARTALNSASAPQRLRDLEQVT